MSIRTSPWPAGVPCWADLGTPDIAAARSFYADVLGWTFEDTGEEYGGYVIAQVADDPGPAAAGIGPLQEGAPPAWTLYLASDDADKTAATIGQHGGSVLAPPFDVGPLGRMCIAADPAGAAFGVWQGKEHIGAGVVNQPGGLVWDDLRSTDPDAARAFYSAVFGYRTDALPEAGDGDDYHTYALPGEEAPLGGMGGMMGAPDGTPSHWIVYFGVADIVAAVADADAAGGTVLLPPFETPYGHMAGVADPAGAAFWVTQGDWSNQPDRAG